MNLKVFISWSGSTSHQLALALKDWVSSVIQQVEPFVSSEDIHKGARWFEVIGSQLDETHFGILCLTPDNVSAPWVLFEAGALAKKLDQAHVAPVLLNVANSQLVGPLSQFNTTTVTEEDLKKLIRTINAKLGDGALPDQRLEAAFAKWWPDLERKIRTIQDQKAEKEPETPRRDATEIVEEVLTLVRTMSQRWPTEWPVPPARYNVERALSQAMLTNKECEVASLLLKGLSTQEMASLTGNSEKTLKQHISTMYEKCGVSSRTEFFHYIFST